MRPNPQFIGMVFILLAVSACSTNLPSQTPDLFDEPMLDSMLTPPHTPDFTAVPILIFTATPTNSPESQPTLTPVDLDLQEANVVVVEVENLGDGRYRFDVTLLHDDDGEAPSYANWWQVDSQEGQELGRRVLTHAHSTAPFTRSQVIEIPDGVTIVIVRGHDMLHGYGGQAMLVNLDTGETTALMDFDL